MNQEATLRQLQARWPETTDYLTLLGQTTNDLMVLRELRSAEKSIPSWLDRLGIEMADLLTIPSAAEVLRFLWSRQIVVNTALTVPEYQEWWEDYETRFESGETTAYHLLEETDFTLSAAADEQLWSLPEVGLKLMSWAVPVAKDQMAMTERVSLAQASIMLRLALIMQQEPGMSPGWVAECWQSLHSSEFFQKAGNQPTLN